MRKTYLAAAILGMLFPNILVLKISIETRNIMLYGDIPATISEMFSNEIATVFIIDLLLLVLMFLLWSFREAKRLGMKEWWVTTVVTMTLGLAGGLPLFLYLREGYKSKASQ